MADKVSKFIFPVKSGNTIADKEFDLPSGGTTYVDELPYAFYGGSAVVYNNEIHILGGNNGSFMGTTKHYKWNGSSWVSVSTLPYNFYEGSAVVYNNEIYILGGLDNGLKCYKWDGSSWVSVSTLPYEFISGVAVVYNNEIHILGCDGNRTAHYKWNETAWSEVSTLPYDFYFASAVVYNNEIHILGSRIGDGTKHYKWNGSSWVSVSTLPYSFKNGSAVVYNNEIHILGGVGEFIVATKHCKWNGTSWVSVSTLPYSFFYGSAVAYNNEIHILGGVDESGFVGLTNHYKWNDSSWANKFTVYTPAKHNHDDRYYTKEEIDEDFGENTFVGTTAEWNALTTEQQNAYDCRVLTDDDLDTKNVIDNLNSDSSTDALSAKQGKVLKGLIDSKSDSDYHCRYTNMSNSINFIDSTSGKTMFHLDGVLTLKDNILTFDCYSISVTSDYPSGGMILQYTADLSSTFADLSNYEWDTDWIDENNVYVKYGLVDSIGWCAISSEGVNTPMDYVSGNGLKIRLTHMGSFQHEVITPDFLRFSAKIKPRTT